jgi:hypothetical protein
VPNSWQLYEAIHKQISSQLGWRQDGGEAGREAGKPAGPGHGDGGPDDPAPLGEVSWSLYNDAQDQTFCRGIFSQFGHRSDGENNVTRIINQGVSSSLARGDSSLVRRRTCEGNAVEQRRPGSIALLPDRSSLATRVGAVEGSKPPCGSSKLLWAG